MNKISKVIVLIVLVSFYFIIINLISSIDFSNLNNSLSIQSTSSSPTEEQAAFGDSVAVTAYKEGLFWNIRSLHYPTYTDSTIYFFGFISLPLKIHDFNFFYIHLVAAILFLVITLLILFYERRYYE